VGFFVSATFFQFPKGQKILKDGVALNSDEENLAEITEQAEVFHKKHLPIFRALQIV